MPQETILIVDDNPTNLGVLFDSLREIGYRVLIHTDGESALATSREVPPDLILLDIMMPGIDGLETCRRLKADEITRHIPVIFMTALSDAPDEVKGLEVGAVDYIAKPIKIEIVAARVKTHLMLRKFQKELEEKNAELQAALNNIKTLRGLIPICANCKKVRDDEGFWQQVEVYVKEHTEAQFTHGICPDCMDTLYPSLHQKIEQRKQIILDTLEQMGGATVADIATTLALPEDHTLNHLETLQDQGKVSYIIVDGDRFYKSR